eukprot:102639_1
MANYSRSRARTVAVSKRSSLQKMKGINKTDRHTLLLKAVKDLGHDMDVFHLRWMPGELLDQDMLQSVPIFWFKKFGWTSKDLHALYMAGQVVMTDKTKSEITLVYGKGRGKTKRTRRLHKKVNAVPTKVRVVDNRSEMNIQNVGFPDMNYISGQDLQQLVDEAVHEEAKAKEIPPDSLPQSPLVEISENEEKVIDTTSMVLSLSPAHSKPTMKRVNSLHTPFGDVDANATINIRQKHRRTSSLLRREHNMLHYGEIVWNKLAILSERGDTLSQRQFDIELQNNSILADPDICKELFRTIQAKDPVDKKKINKADMDRVCAELDKIPLIHEIAAETIKDEDQKIWIVLKQVFVHIAQNESFDVAVFLTVKLSTSDLNNVDTLLEYISSRHKEWMTRLQIMKWITANLETSDAIRELTSDENIGPFLLGWMCQCLDERSNLAKAALEMFPNILSIAMTQTGEAFEFLDDIFSSLFMVLRNKRSKDLNETANECCVQCVDMIMDWHEHGELDNEVLLEICHIFRDNTKAKEQKHEKVRERCCAYFGYIIFGIHGKTNDMDITNDNDEPVNHLAPASGGHHQLSRSANDVDVEAKWEPAARASIVGHKNALKISKTMKRIYLLEEEHQQFIEYMNDAMNNGLCDKSADARNTAFKLMEKLEKVEYERNILEDVMSIDVLAMSKFKKWKERKEKSKQRGKKGSKKK